jgi:hypothetical protein
MVRGRVAATATVVVLLFAACGKHTPANNPDDARPVTTEADTLPVITSANVKTGAKTLVAQHTAKVEIRLDIYGYSATSTVGVDLKKKRATGDFEDGSGTPFPFVVDGPSLYVHPHGGWARLDFTGALAATRIAGPTGADPFAYLSALTQAGAIKEVGSKAVNGYPTTQFRADLDPRIALRAAGAPDGIVNEIVAAGVQIVANVYIDNLGRVIRISETLISGAFAVDIQVDFSKFGKPVAVTVPAAAEVVSTTSAATEPELRLRLDALFP